MILRHLSWKSDLLQLSYGVPHSLPNIYQFLKAVEHRYCNQNQFDRPRLGIDPEALELESELATIELWNPSLTS